MSKVVIIGAGPAGIMAAIVSAENGNEVTLIEHNDRVGKKILVTGNGKCNLTNMDMNADCYRSDSKESYFSVIEKFNADDLRKFFYEIGLPTKDKNGYVYPFTEQASSVLNALRFELDRLKVKLITEAKVLNVKKCFEIITDKGQFKADKLILATGGMAAPKTGSDGSGFEIAKQLGHTVIKPLPALTQLKCKENFFKGVAGVRTNATVTFVLDGIKQTGDTGELQLTDYGISGIPVFQISRYVIKSIETKENPKVIINFYPGGKKNELEKILKLSFSHNDSLNALEALSGIFNNKLAALFLKESGIGAERKSKSLTDKEIDKLIWKILAFEVTPISHNGFQNAQVSSGGIPLDEINIETMESKKCKNLFFAGEILDVDGKCGGYNLQWAFSSGHLCGRQL